MTRPALHLLRAALLAGACAAPGLAHAQPQLAGAPMREPGLRTRYAAPTDVGPPSATPLPESYPARSIRVGTGAGAVRQLSLPRGRSATIELPVDARDVMVSNPAVADVALSTPRRIYVMGASSGQTDATFVDGAGHQILRLDIRVDQDSSALQQTLARLLPGAAIHVEAANNSLILSGEASSAAEADKAARLAAAFVTDPHQVVNMIAVSGAEQVMLQVKVVEVNRTVIKQLGFDLGAIMGAAGGPQYSLIKDATYGVAGAILGGITGGYNLNTTTQPTSAITSTSLTTLASGGMSNIASATSSTASAAATGTGTYAYTTAALINPATGLPVTVNGVPQTVTLNGLGQVVNSSGSTSNITTQAGMASNGTTTTTANNGLSSKSQQLLSGRAGSNGLNQANAMIQAFERVGLVRTLAEPSLTAISGESANFLAGGEFPVPVGQDSTGRITVEFKQYGVGLGFTPVVLSSGRISLKISTEVSEISSVGGFTLSNSGSGSATTGPSLVIPGLSVRRAQTVVELPSGGAMAIAGLMQSVTRQTLDSLPGLMQLPVLGSLFRSRDFQQDESELVVIVTPYLVKPTRPDQLSTPADGLVIADDLQTNLLGKINTVNKTPPAAVAGKTYQGPYGYVVD